MLPATFGQMIREARLQRHLSMGQLAAAVERSTASVRRWERDDGLPTPDVVDALILRLGLDRDEVEAALGPEASEDEAGIDTDAPTVEEGDPLEVVPLVDVAEAVAARSAVAWQQPTLPEHAPAPTAPVRRQPTPTAPMGWPTASIPVAVVEQDRSLLRIIRDPDRPWLGYIRAGLTIALLVGLIWVLTWAVPEFLDAVGETWDSLWQREGTSV